MEAIYSNTSNSKPPVKTDGPTKYLGCPYRLSDLLSHALTPELELETREPASTEAKMTPLEAEMVEIVIL